MLLALAGYYAWRQRETLRQVRTADDLSDDERHYLTNQAWRRLVGSAFMILFAGLLAGSFLIEGRATELADRMAAANDQNEELVLTPEDERFRNFYAGYWIVLLLGVLAILALAGY